MAYRGKYTPINKEKYVGDASKVVYRSLWERNVFRWADKSKNVEAWASEEIIIPYVCGTDNKVHRYFIDLWLKMDNGKTYIIEIKPKKETAPPKTPKRRSPKYIREGLTYVKNQSKWVAANKFAEQNGLIFQIWTEDVLRAMGIKILSK